MKELVSRLKAEYQDHEWYPTTKKMLAKISSDLENRNLRYRTSDPLRILDIGAGDGNALKILREQHEGVEAYAIEKSTMLVNAMPPDIYVVGTLFLLDPDCPPAHSGGRFEGRSGDAGEIEDHIAGVGNCPARFSRLMADHEQGNSAAASSASVIAGIPSSSACRCPIT